MNDLFLRDYAIKALISIGSDAAAEVLIAELDHNQGSDKIAVINALGEMRHKAAGTKLMEQLKENNTEIKLAALFALANIGHENAQKSFQNIKQTENPVVRDKAVLYYLTWLANLDDEQRALSLCRCRR